MLSKMNNFLSMNRRMFHATNGASSIIVEKLGAVTTIGINRPEKRNCVNPEIAQELKDAISSFEKDNESLVGVLYGTGGNFCSGYDLSEVADETKFKSTWDFLSHSGTMGPTHQFIKKPLIAAVSGYAVAGGFELALMCDLRVLEENAVMGVYCRRFGVPLIDGGTVRLTAMVGLSRALDLILTGRSLSAKEAFHWGIANKVVAYGAGYGQAVNLALSLVKFPQACMLADRASAYNAAYSSAQDELLKYEREKGMHAINDETVAGAKKFLRGIGKHGKSYNLTEKEVLPWETCDDFIAKNKL